MADGDQILGVHNLIPPSPPSEEASSADQPNVNNSTNEEISNDGDGIGEDYGDDESEHDDEHSEEEEESEEEESSEEEDDDEQSEEEEESEEEESSEEEDDDEQSEEEEEPEEEEPSEKVEDKQSEEDEEESEEEEEQSDGSQTDEPLHVRHFKRTYSSAQIRKKALKELKKEKRENSQSQSQDETEEENPVAAFCAEKIYISYGCEDDTGTSNKPKIEEPLAIPPDIVVENRVELNEMPFILEILKLKNKKKAPTNCPLEAFSFVRTIAIAYYNEARVAYMLENNLQYWELCKPKKSSNTLFGYSYKIPRWEGMSNLINSLHARIKAVSDYVEAFSSEYHQDMIFIGSNTHKQYVQKCWDRLELIFLHYLLMREVLTSLAETKIGADFTDQDKEECLQFCFNMVANDCNRWSKWIRTVRDVALLFVADYSKKYGDDLWNSWTSRIINPGSAHEFAQAAVKSANCLDREDLMVKELVRLGKYSLHPKRRTIQMSIAAIKERNKKRKNNGAGLYIEFIEFVAAKIFALSLQWEADASFKERIVLEVNKETGHVRKASKKRKATSPASKPPPPPAKPPPPASNVNPPPPASKPHTSAPPVSKPPALNNAAALKPSSPTPTSGPPASKPSPSSPTPTSGPPASKPSPSSPPPSPPASKPPASKPSSPPPTPESSSSSEETTLVIAHPVEAELAYRDSLMMPPILRTGNLGATYWREDPWGAPLTVVQISRINSLPPDKEGWYDGDPPIPRLPCDWQSRAQTQSHAIVLKHCTNEQLLKGAYEYTFSERLEGVWHLQVSNCQVLLLKNAYRKHHGFRFKRVGGFQLRRFYKDEDPFINTSETWIKQDENEFSIKPFHGLFPHQPECKLLREHSPVYGRYKHFVWQEGYTPCFNELARCLWNYQPVSEYETYKPCGHVSVHKWDILQDKGLPPDLPDCIFQDIGNVAVFLWHCMIDVMYGQGDAGNGIDRGRKNNKYLREVLRIDQDARMGFEHVTVELYVLGGMFDFDLSQEERKEFPFRQTAKFTIVLYNAGLSLDKPNEPDERRLVLVFTLGYMQTKEGLLRAPADQRQEGTTDA